MGLPPKVGAGTEKLVEPVIGGAIHDLGVEVDAPIGRRNLVDVRQAIEVHAEVPLADGRGTVAVTLEQRAQRGAVGPDQRPVVTTENA